MEITELYIGEADAWDLCVYESDASTFYHQIGWRNVVADCLIFRCSNENESGLVAGLVA